MIIVTVIIAHQYLALNAVCSQIPLGTPKATSMVPGSPAERPGGAGAGTARARKGSGPSSNSVTWRRYSCHSSRLLRREEVEHVLAERLGDQLAVLHHVAGVRTGSAAADRCRCARAAPRGSAPHTSSLGSGARARSPPRSPSSPGRQDHGERQVGDCRPGRASGNSILVALPFFGLYMGTLMRADRLLCPQQM